MYELYIEGYKVDIDQKISVQLSFAIDDVANFSSRETGFSKTIVLPGTGRNNQIFGYIYDLGSFNYEQPGAPNIGAFFNVAQTSRAELRLNGLLVLRGVFRITNIIKDKDIIEYEGAIFGELAGFVAKIGNKKIEELDFSEYDHYYTRDNIVNSWDNTHGSGYYYPLIDYGTFSNDKISYQYKTLRPALYAKEYIDKMFAAAGFNYTSTFLNTSFFKSLIIPNNQKAVFKKSVYNIDAVREASSTTSVRNLLLSFTTVDNNADWLVNLSKNQFTYIGVITQTLELYFKGLFTFNVIGDGNWSLRVLKNGSLIAEEPINVNDFVFITNINVSTNDIIQLRLFYNVNESVSLTFSNLNFQLYTSANPLTEILLNEFIELNQTIPKTILQKDFFTWILKMFNLYVTEDKLRDKHLIIEPYVDFYGTDTIDWSYKVDHSKPWQIKPMGVLNGRFFEFKFKDDNDFYNEGYKKKFNLSYGDRLEDTGYQFAKDKQSIELGFSPSVLVQYNGTDKILPAIYKKSKGNAVDQEELTDSNIRILLAKKINDVDSWYIKNGNDNLGAVLNSYGYAGHFDDPINPTKDINFGAASEIYFDPNSYTSNNLYNDYWSEYIAEIADKDSKILSCYVYLTPLDIAQLDFSKAISIDGIRFRLNKIEDYDYTNNELVKVELLKIINNG